jgi:hypothetical protein
MEANMKSLALIALACLALWGVACTNSPTAVDDAQLVVPDGGGTATASRVAPARAPSAVCQLGKVEVKAYRSVQLTNDSSVRIVSFRAVYYDPSGQLAASCTEPPVWMVTPLDNHMTFNPARFDPFEARLTADKGSYLVTAFGPDKTYGEVQVGW